ncbi:3-isopropylmalate dehydratase small subunit [uncultured Roseobacter sp.]|uniref:3-isopropylmalate dehydratase small subunit n=1 Tax=uncultured Roseobacter sp. TaxID=114847 RepID=UPI002637639D|nr:3-isopropylmalate dehydratase small subunit [uncultured Roseobacter sp.]
MAGWSTHAGLAVALPLANIDTDQLIPARFMSVPRADGYGQYLLHDLRRDAEGTLKQDCALNAHADASILIAGDNFGSGSSREAAVYVLVDAGFRAVIAPGFGDIFASNAVNNGLLPARIGAADYDALIDQLGGGTVRASVDLEAGRITLAETIVTFVLDESWRIKLINGWDDIDLTQQHRNSIDTFKDHRRRTAAWAWPAAVE